MIREHGEEREETLRRDDGTELFVRSEGAGPTVVLAHGLLDRNETFSEVVPRLVRSGYRVVRFDQRGHGRSRTGRDGLSPRSMAGDYVAVLEHFGVDDGVLVGHSMGAFLSVVFSILHADVARARLRGLVLAGGHAGDVGASSLQNRIQIRMIELGAMRVLQKSTTAARWMCRSLFGDVVDPHLLDAGVETALAADFKGTLPILRAQVAESYYARLGEIPIPAIVICGDRDRTCPRSHSERLGAGIRGSRNVWLPRIGHMVPYEAPEAVISAVEEHFAKSGR